MRPSFILVILILFNFAVHIPFLFFPSVDQLHINEDSKDVIYLSGKSYNFTHQPQLNLEAIRNQSLRDLINIVDASSNITENIKSEEISNKVSEVKKVTIPNNEKEIIEFLEEKIEDCKKPTEDPKDHENSNEAGKKKSQETKRSNARTTIQNPPQVNTKKEAKPDPKIKGKEADTSKVAIEINLKTGRVKVKAIKESKINLETSIKSPENSKVNIQVDLKTDKIKIKSEKGGQNIQNKARRMNLLKKIQDFRKEPKEVFQSGNTKIEENTQVGTRPFAQKKVFLTRRKELIHTVAATLTTESTRFKASEQQNKDDWPLSFGEVISLAVELATIYQTLLIGSLIILLCLFGLILLAKRFTSQREAIENRRQASDSDIVSQ